MATTRAILLPENAHFPAANFPALTALASGGNRLVLAYDAATDETAYWTLIAPQGMANALSLVCHCVMASATSNNVIMGAAVEAITPADAVDLDAGTSFDTANVSSATAVAGTAGYDFTVSITLTNKDSVAAGDYMRISIYRDADAGGDDAAGDLYLLAAELREA